MPRFSIDLPDDLNTWLEEQAKAASRSKAKQVAHLLKLYRDIISAHASGLQRPGYSLQDEQWLSMKGNSKPVVAKEKEA